MLSIIIPSYNEEGNVAKCASVVSKLLSENGIDYELVFVNDGSKDRTWELICALHQENAKLRTKLEELRYVSRAKCLLIVKQQMTEETAHRYIEKNAMDTRRTRKDVAMEIIAKYEY